MLGSSLGLVSCQSTPQVPGSNTLNSFYYDGEPSLSGDGRWLAFVSERTGRSELRLYDLRNRRFVDLPQLADDSAIAQSPSLSRTGRYLAYLANRDGRPQIILIDRITRESTILTKNYRGWLRNPQLSPDGRYVWFETSRRGQWDIEMLDRGPDIEPDLPEGVTVTPPPDAPN
ncbi:MAG: biopolymer transporter Tol [Cyanobacteria bacterium P01_H01_bin.15]